MPLREAYAVAAGSELALLHELELLAERARLDLMPPEAGPHHAKQGLEEPLGPTPREAEVLTLVARGLTNREIAAALVISAKTEACTSRTSCASSMRRTGPSHASLTASSPPHPGRREFDSPTRWGRGQGLPSGDPRSRQQAPRW